MTDPVPIIAAQLNPRGQTVRRRPLILAIATALTPVVCTLSAAPAQASGSTLTVTTIGRNGAKIADSVVNLVNTRTYTAYQGKSGTRLTLPAGPYVVTTDIETPVGLWKVGTV